MGVLNVELGNRSYPVRIDRGLLARADLFPAGLQQGAVCIVTDDNVAPLYLKPLTKTLAEFAPQHRVLPHGEEHKSWPALDHIFQRLLKHHFGRDAVLI